jgi:hypothetical protein
VRPLPRPTGSALTRCAGVVAAVAAATLLTGCGGDSPTASTSTVTVTASSTPSATHTPAATATTDVKGRAHDLGTITDVSTVAGDLVVEIDRWTDDGVSDPQLAKEGVEVAPHRGQVYSNQNTAKTYTAIVAPGAKVVENTCVVAASGELGMTSDPKPAAQWLTAPHPDVVLAITYDSGGRITRMDTDPVCS